uniref:Peroxin-19 n=1 Tax=Globodera rostochiensis TaxID=31243 RepID=A0A914HAP6_GLORO
MAANSASKLVELLDDALNDFKPPPVKANDDDDLDEFMQKGDSEATQKAAQKFQAMLEGMVRRNKADEAEESTSSKGKLDIAKSIANLAFVGGDSCDKELERELDKLSFSKGSLDDLMDTIVQTAVSKEAMYPAIKELHSKFGPFLEEKSAEFDSSTLQRYKEQHRVLGLLRNVYEDEAGGSDVEQAKEGKASKIAQLWLEMQKYGLPPPELSRGFPVTNAPDDANLNDCSVM